MFKTRLAALLVAIALVAASCGGSSSEDTTAPSPTEAPAVAQTTVTASPTPTAAPTTAQAPDLFPVTISAANGDIEIVEMPTKIVSMSATHTEMLFAIGAGDQVVAVDAFSNYPAEAPMTDLTGFAPNVEAIVGFGTDLLVTDGDWDGSSVAALTELGIPVLILPAAANLADVYTELEQLGAATGHVADAAVVVAQMQADIDDILQSIPEVTNPLTFYHELDATYYSVTSGTFIGHVYSLMGLENIADAVGEGSFGYPQLSEEHILQQDPDLIFLADTICCGTSVDSLDNRPGWNTLTAVKNGAVAELNDDMASRWGPRIVDYMAAVAEALAALAVNA